MQPQMGRAVPLCPFVHPSLAVLMGFLQGLAFCRFCVLVSENSENSVTPVTGTIKSSVKHPTPIKMAYRKILPLYLFKQRPEAHRCCCGCGCCCFARKKVDEVNTQLNERPTSLSRPMASAQLTLTLTLALILLALDMFGSNYLKERKEMVKCLFRRSIERLRVSSYYGSTLKAPYKFKRFHLLTSTCWFS